MSNKKTAPALTAQAFLNLANQPPRIEIIEVEGLGSVGVLTMSIGQREAMHNRWSELKKEDDSKAGFGALLLQATVCDDNADLVLATLPIDEINKLPVATVEPLLEKAMQLNGFSKKEPAVEQARKN